MKLRNKLKHFLLITKPGIILGNMFSTAAGFFLASRGNVEWFALAMTLLGTSLVVSSACVFNNVIDRKIDANMVRTRSRAMVTGCISTSVAVIYALLLSAFGFSLLGWATNPTTPAVVLAGFIIYVVIYSMYLKRSSEYSALIGSLAGAAPPVAGYCAVTGAFDLGALLLLVVFSLWQMPHCYSIAVYRIEDYSAAGVPVLPLTRGIETARKHITAFIPAFAAAVAMLTLSGYAGVVTFIVVLVLSTLWLCSALFQRKSLGIRLWARRQYVFSIITIVVLCVTLSLDFIFLHSSGTTAVIPPSTGSVQLVSTK